MNEFERLAAHEQAGTFVDFWHLVKRTKKWWLVPLLLLVLAGLTLLSDTAAAPFIYTIF